MNEKHRKRHRQMSPRVRKKREDIRREILTAAKDILEEEGIEGITLAAVASKLHLTKQALYHYFPSKELLIKTLTTWLLKDEIDYVMAEVEAASEEANTLEILIRAFYTHYINNLGAFRMIYCQGQLQSAADTRLDDEQLKTEVNPMTRHLFDLLEQRLAASSWNASKRKKVRRLAFSAWLSALGLMTMLSLTKAMNDPLIHSDRDLLDTLSDVYSSAV